MGDLFADILTKISTGVVGYLAQVNPFLGLLVGVIFATAIYFLRKKVKKIWGSNGETESSSIANNIGEEQKIADNVQSGLDDFLNSKK